MIRIISIEEDSFSASFYVFFPSNNALFFFLSVIARHRLDPDMASKFTTSGGRGDENPSNLEGIFWYFHFPFPLLLSYVKNCISLELDA